MKKKGKKALRLHEAACRGQWWCLVPRATGASTGACAGLLGDRNYFSPDLIQEFGVGNL